MHRASEHHLQVLSIGFCHRLTAHGLLAAFGAGAVGACAGGGAGAGAGRCGSAEGCGGLGSAAAAHTGQLRLLNLAGLQILTTAVLEAVAALPALTWLNVTDAVLLPVLGMAAPYTLHPTPYTLHPKPGFTFL